MQFNSLDFLVFSLVFFPLFYLLPVGIRPFLTLVASFVFYGAWKVEYLGLIFLSTIIDYGCSLWIEKKRGDLRKAKTGLFISLFSNLFILFFFKYLNLFAGSLEWICNWSELCRITWTGTDYELPVGISFYTFQTMSYTIDVYRGQMKAEKSLMRFALYVCFFPQLVAGPIERASHLLKEFQDGFQPNWERWKSGLGYLAFGFFLKIGLADNLSPIADHVFDNSATVDSLSAVLGTTAFSFQIYFDFFGYSTIAIGLGKLVGIDLMDNFKRPYLAANIDDFWKRWHISLTSWFRDYLYIPIGGNRGGASRTYANVFIVFLISGLWHGASWNFVIWGALHGVAIILYRLFWKSKWKLPRLVSIPFMFILATAFWIPFRAKGLSEMSHMGLKFIEFFYGWIPGLVKVRASDSLNFVLESLNRGQQIGLGITFSVFLVMELATEFAPEKSKRLFRSSFWVLLLVFLTLLFGTFENRTFIYFQF
ncbi:MAG: MBOAT family protein [Bdellovibrionales bacterium]|nr:MBOAT family protein [Bdellovibrionales bacterium]